MVDVTGADVLSAGETVTRSFTISVDDGNGGSDESAFTVEVTGVNDDPTAGNDTATTDEAQAISNVVFYLQVDDAGITQLKIDGWNNGTTNLDDVNIGAFVDHYYAGYELLAVSIKAGNNRNAHLGPAHRDARFLGVGCRFPASTGRQLARPAFEQPPVGAELVRRPGICRTVECGLTGLNIPAGEAGVDRTPHGECLRQAGYPTPVDPVPSGHPAEQHRMLLEPTRPKHGQPPLAAFRPRPLRSSRMVRPGGRTVFAMDQTAEPPSTRGADSGAPAQFAALTLRQPGSIIIGG